MYEMNAYLEDLIDEIRFTWREYRSEVSKADTLEDIADTLVGTPLLSIYLNLLKAKPMLKFEEMSCIVNQLESAVDEKTCFMSLGLY